MTSTQTQLGLKILVLGAIAATFFVALPLSTYAALRDASSVQPDGGGEGGVGEIVRQCNDGIDNDGNGVTDYPSDLGCTTATDNTESGYSTAAQCADGVDNDGNGFTDTSDPGCSSSSDTSESGYTTQCSDNVDNDANGYKDTNDPGCSSLTDTTEAGYTPPPAPPPGLVVYKTQSKRDFLGPKVYPDQTLHGGFTETAAHGYPTYSVGQASPTGTRICHLYDPSAFITEWSLGGFDSPGNNKMAAWNPSTGLWYRQSANSFGNKRYNYLTCKTNAPPDTSLTGTANGVTSSALTVTSGTPVTLTWLSEYGIIRKGTFTSENFNLTTFVPGHWITYTEFACPTGGGSGDDGYNETYIVSGQRQTQTAAYGDGCIPYTETEWIPDSNAFLPYGGSTIVTPTQTTTYTYRGTNVNGSSSASVTVTVEGAGGLSSSTCSVTPIVAGTGENVTWTAAPVGGTGTYTYVWSGTDSLSGTTQSVVKSYSTEGSKTGSVQITSGAEVANISCTTALTISNDPACSNGADDNGTGGTDYPADPSCTSPTDDTEDGNIEGASVSCTVDSAVVTAGTQTTYHVIPAGGATAPYTWTPSSQTGCTGGVDNTCTFTNPGPYTMSVEASNSDPVSCPVVTVGCVGTPEVSLTANGEAEDTRVNEGESATIAWDAEGISATSCTLYENEVAIQTLTPNACNVTGSVSRVIDTQMVYTLDCGGNTDTVIVNIDAGPQEF